MEMFIPELLANAMMMFLYISINATHRLQPFARSLSLGLAIAMGLLVVLPYHAIINPAIVIALAIDQQLPWQEVTPYVIAQVIGVLVGCWLAFIVHHPIFKKNFNEENLALLHIESFRGNYVRRFFGEGIATLVLVLLFRVISTLPASNFLYPFWCSLAYVSLHLATGFGMNPAIAIGARLGHGLFPIENKKSMNLVMGVISVASSILGAIIALQVIHVLQLG